MGEVGYGGVKLDPEFYKKHNTEVTLVHIFLTPKDPLHNIYQKICKKPKNL